ncbi:MAG: SEC-C metal-binding domain-containing protein [Prolixibacteraceae bacterium]
MVNTGDFTLEEMLLQDTKEKIVRNADLLRIRINKNERKAVVAHRVAQTILHNPLVVLFHIPFQEVLRLQEMVQAEDHSVAVRYGLVQDCITEIGLTDFRWDGESQREFIYPDLAKAFKPVISQFLRAVDRDGSKLRREQLVLGLLNLYGVLSLTELAELCLSYEADFLLDDVFKTVFGSYLIHSCERLLKDRVIYTSPFLINDPEVVLKEIAMRKSLSLAKFTKDEVLAAGQPESPQPPQSAASIGFRRQLLGVVGKEHEADWWTSQFWMTLNNDRDPMGLFRDMFTEFNAKPDLANIILRAMVDWANQLPKWIMKGNNSSATFQLSGKPAFIKQPPQLVVGPNARKAGIDVSQEQFNTMWEKTVGSQASKVGRNDPCPCGSGKKFKHCCGSH